MGNLFTLTPDILNLAQGGIDDIINQLGKNCELIFSPKMVFCPNCVFDPVGRKSSNIWSSGGSISFPNGQICPLCSGKGCRAEQITKIIKLLCHYDPKKFVTKLPANIEVGSGIVETKGYITDLESVLQSREMILQPELSPYIKWRYKLVSEPSNPSNIIQNRYFYCIWQRIGG